jgi:hypothetical protein
MPPPGGGYQPQMGGYASPRNDGMATASLILGILGVVCCGILAPVAAILGFMSRNRIAQSGGALGGGGLAMAGLILGIIGTVLWIIGIIFYAVNLSHLSTTT